MLSHHDADDLVMSDEEFDGEDLVLEPTIQNILDQKSLQWIFVGGKGGVGKTTISSSIAMHLAKVRKNVLLISTDPAHNLSDAFAQKFSKDPTLVNGFDNLYCVEIDPSDSKSALSGLFGEEDENSEESGIFKNLMKNVSSNMPGLDEVESFVHILKQVRNSNFDVVVFDTAPTGHTLRLLSLPNVLKSTLGNILGSNIGKMITQFGSVFGSSGATPQIAEEQLHKFYDSVDQITQQFQDSTKTTFICVCIPEFLSVYETERLVQELTNSNIDSHNIVVNQLVLKDTVKEPCEMCQARKAIQSKYLKQVFELYEDFHIIQMPLLGKEVRGVEALNDFKEMLLNPTPLAYKREDLK
ncbi:predicted protein [Naegleria gruberi]|uniref:ATPase ASNA1 homolog n=1 Tax=Naegleria gruberi TaxID=5762 RepID=D2VRQ1_NAEGR|nr:uncharacterized protein NAEGRDRAFT_71664 [Naegleria gruberi]EFC40503.1 predicted protein [Naegleria gruberi]|eukprot:XP_002673247.1 predicted protein [Naegleria gruberi strain NEG-M]